MEISLGLARKRGNTAAPREELEPNKKKTQKSVAEETRNVMGNQEETQSPTEDEPLPDPSVEGSAFGQRGHLELGKLQYARAGMPTPVGRQQNE